MLVVAIKNVSALQCTLMAPADGGRLCHEEVSPAKKKSFTISSTDRQPLLFFLCLRPGGGCVTIRVTTRPTAAAAWAALRGNDTWLRLPLLTFQTRHCDKFFYSDFRNRKTISLNKHLMQAKRRGTGFPPKLSRGKKSQHFCRIIAHTCNIAGQTQMTTVNR